LRSSTRIQDLQEQVKAQVAEVDAAKQGLQVERDTLFSLGAKMAKEREAVGKRKAEVGGQSLASLEAEKVTVQKAQEELEAARAALEAEREASRGEIGNGEGGAGGAVGQGRRRWRGAGEELRGVDERLKARESELQQRVARLEESEAALGELEGAGDGSHAAARRELFAQERTQARAGNRERVEKEFERLLRRQRELAAAAEEQQERAQRAEAEVEKERQQVEERAQALQAREEAALFAGGAAQGRAPGR